MIRFRVALALLLVPVLAPAAGAQDSFYRVAIRDLRITSGELPTHPAQAESWWVQYKRQDLAPRAVLLVPGEVYYDNPLWDGELWSQEGSWNPSDGFLSLRAPGSGTLEGRLYFPNPAWDAQVSVGFEVSAESIVEDGRDFWLAQERHYMRLMKRGLPGAAYFRHRHGGARAALEGQVESDPVDESRSVPDAEGELLATYSLLSGGRALSENLQLDRSLPASSGEEDAVELDEIQGITVREFDWGPLLEERSPEMDALARFVPADQHVVFFPSFGAMVDLLDEAAELGAPVLTLYERRSQDARTRERYERQLCLELDTLARTFGGLLIQSVAFTGSDPYLRTGSDVAVLLGTADRDSARQVLAFVQARQRVVAQALGMEPGQVEVGGVTVEALVSPARDVSSYATVLEDCVVVTNSRVQLQSLLDVTRGGSEAMGASSEYAFFRQRYAYGDDDEAALIVIPDAAIRRWCSPRWRIATSRRTRAAAALAELQAQHLATLQDLPEPSLRLEVSERHGALGTVTLTPQGVHSSIHGRLDFQTPIAELEFERVGEREAELYRLWRNGYQRNWSRYFDPIAIRIETTDERIGFDMTVMPLILGTEYDDLREFVGQAKLSSASGDPHANTFLHFAMAVDPESGPIRQVGEEMAGMMSKVGANLMDWMGGSLAVYLEDSPVLDTLLAAEDTDAALDEAMGSANSIPIVVHFDVGSGFRLAAFMATFWAFVDQSAPGMLVRETQSAGDLRYVRVREKALGQDLALFYATTPTAFILSLNEQALLAALHRDEARRTSGDGATQGASGESPWLGESLALEVDRRGIEIAELLQGSDLAEQLRERSFRNLPILNEWRTRFPDEDPVQLHGRLWGETLRCPGGGTYVWSAEHHTMQSTQYGHPAAPRAGADLPPVFANLTRLRLGLTFENEGLRSRAEILRDGSGD